MLSYRYTQQTMTMSSDMRTITSLIKLNFACFGKSLGRPVCFADHQQLYIYTYIMVFVCMYVCIYKLPARALYIDQLQHRRVECWSISVAYALRKMLFLNDSPKLSWLWPGPDQQPVPHTHSHTHTYIRLCMYIPAQIWSTAAVQSTKWSNEPLYYLSCFRCIQNAHDLSPCLDCNSHRSKIPDLWSGWKKIKEEAIPTYL